MKRVLPLALFIALTACSGIGGQSSPTATAMPTARATPEPTATPTPDPVAAYEAAVCTDVVDALPDIGKQMTPVLEAVFDNDAQTVAREGVKLRTMVQDLFDALDRAPDYPPAHTFESRLRSSLQTYLDGLDAAQTALEIDDASGVQKATGLFQASLDLFNEGKDEFRSLGIC